MEGSGGVFFFFFFPEERGVCVLHILILPNGLNRQKKSGEGKKREDLDF